jgi:hypothetical protein
MLRNETHKMIFRLILLNATSVMPKYEAMRYSGISERRRGLRSINSKYRCSAERVINDSILLVMFK